MCFEPYTLNDLTTKYGKEPKKRYCGYNPIDTSERREKIRTMMGLDKDFNLHDVLVTQKNCLCIDDSYKNIDCYTLQHIVDMICFDEYVDCQHFFRQIFLGYFSDIVQAFDTLRKNVCGDDYTSLHNPIVLSSVLPAYGMFHSIQILFL